MENPKPIPERLRNSKSQSSLNYVHCEATASEEYPKLRKPKPETLLKIRAHKKNPNLTVSMTIAVTSTDDNTSVEVPLRQEFLNKKEQLEKATISLLKKYELRKSQGNLLDNNTINAESDISPLHTELEPCKETSVKSLNYCEQLLTNIIYTKVKAHPNGIFAESLPHWYKKTFGKDLTIDWLNLLRVSNKFDIEKIQNKIVLYTKEINEGSIITTELDDSGDKTPVMKFVKKFSPFNAKECDMRTESSVGFIRYKHLQKSLNEYRKIAICNTRESCCDGQ